MDAPPGNTGKRMTQWPHPALGTVVNPIPGAISLDVSWFSPFSCKYGLAQLGFSSFVSLWQGVGESPVRESENPKQVAETKEYEVGMGWLDGWEGV